MNKREKAWLKTASPFLLKKFIKPKGLPPKQYFDDNGNKITKKKYNLLKSRTKQKTKKKRNTRIKYDNYILSKKWAQRRLEFYKKFGRFCFACESNKKLHVHHMSYKNLGYENDSELSVLCEICHDEYHKINGVQKDMIERTLLFIRNKKRRNPI